MLNFSSNIEYNKHSQCAIIVLLNCKKEKHYYNKKIKCADFKPLILVLDWMSVVIFLKIKILPTHTTHRTLFSCVFFLSIHPLTACPCGVCHPHTTRLSWLQTGSWHCVKPLKNKLKKKLHYRKSRHKSKRWALIHQQDAFICLPSSIAFPRPHVLK